MASKQNDASAYFQFARSALAPVTRWNELAIRSFEQYARFQYEVAGDCLQVAIDQLNAIAAAKDLGALTARQAEIANRAVDKVTRRSHEFMKLASDTQTQLASWAEDTAAATRKAA